jgi:hydrogenase 3 maturation protease
MMDNQLTKLKNIVRSFPLIIGMGNELRGDDAAGIILADHLVEGGYPAVINVNGNPENYLKKISEMPGNLRLWIDIINWGGQVGEFRIIESDDIHHFAISTHNFSPVILLSYLKETRNIPDYFLGIQPYSVNLGSPVSPPVKKTVEFLSSYILKNRPA